MVFISEGGLLLGEASSFAPCSEERYRCESVLHCRSVIRTFLHPTLLAKERLKPVRKEKQLAWPLLVRPGGLLTHVEATPSGPN